MKHRIFILCLLLLTLTTALADVDVRDMSLDLLGSSVHYPQLTGLDPAVQSTVNAAIMEEGRINDRLTRMAMLSDSPVKLNVSYAYTLQGDVFSCAILADGAVETSRATQVWNTVNYDLSTGEEITFADLFTDVERMAECIIASSLI